MTINDVLDRERKVIDLTKFPSSKVAIAYLGGHPLESNQRALVRKYQSVDDNTMGSASSYLLSLVRNIIPSSLYKCVI